jgi:RNA polymerase subunit RPABC4/transcription elongation factor Spt4
MCVTTVPTRIGEEWIGMRVLLIEDDSATAQSIELMLKSESFNVSNQFSAAEPG